MAVIPYLWHCFYFWTISAPGPDTIFLRAMESSAFKLFHSIIVLGKNVCSLCGVLQKIRSNDVGFVVAD